MPEKDITVESLTGIVRKLQRKVAKIERRLDDDSPLTPEELAVLAEEEYRSGKAVRLA